MAYTVYIVYSFQPLMAYTAILLYVENVVYGMCQYCEI